jgi:hypothetical protein
MPREFSKCIRYKDAIVWLPDDDDDDDDDLSWTEKCRSFNCS